MSRWILFVVVLPWVCFSMLVAAVTLGQGGSVVAAESRPNILWLTSEDHGPHLGCYGDRLARTPNVDGLAGKGMRFNRAWSCYPVCAPARSTLIMGMYPASTGAEQMRSMVPMPTGTRMYPQILREAGYYCSNNSKEDYNLAARGRVWDDSSKTAHWQNRRPEQPFFAVFNSTKSHESQVVARPHALITDPKKVRVPAYHPDTPEVRQDWAQYYDKVSEADADAGQRLQELADAGLTENTIVFYYADHGCGLPRNKRWPCNSGLQVPFVIYFPERWRHLAPAEYAAGGESDRLVSFVDFAPTLLSLAGVEPPSWMQGYAFAGQYQTEPRPFVYGARGRMDERADFVRSVTDGRYVYLRNYFLHVSQGQHVSFQFKTPTTQVWRRWFDEGKANEAQSIFWRVPKAPEELYDLQTDPDEVRNLAGSAEHQPILKRLRQAQRDHAARIRDLGFLPESEMHSRSLGSTPYDMARDTSKYLYERISSIAERAASLDADAIHEFATAMTDSDSAVRWWGALGYLMRGAPGVKAGLQPLRAGLKDESPHVRMIAAQALVQFGDSTDLDPSLHVLRLLLSSEKQGALATIAALGAVDAVGESAAPLWPTISVIKEEGTLPDPRYGTYIPRLIDSIKSRLKDQPPSAAAESTGKKKIGEGE